MKKAIWIPACLVFGWLVVCSGCTSSSEAESTTTTAEPQSFVLEVNILDIRPERIEATLELVGTMIPCRVATLSAEVDGTVQAFCESNRQVSRRQGGGVEKVILGLDLGHPVKRGQVVCQIDPTDYQLALESARAGWELSKRNLADLLAWKRPEEITQLEAGLDEARATLERANLDLKRSEKMVAKKAIPQADYDEAVMTMRTALAAVKRTEAALALAKAGPTPEQIAVAQSQIAQAEAECKRQEQQLRKTSLIAPYDGVVVDRFVSVGDQVTAGGKTQILRIIDPDALFAEITVPEKYQHLVRIDNRVQIRVPGSKRTVEGVVDLVNEMVDPATRTFRVRAAFDNRDRWFKAGSFVNVEIPVASATATLVVPKSAVMMTGGEPAVFVCREGRVQRRPIRLGIGSRTAWEVIDGLEPGEQIVADRPSMLTSGMRVRPSQLQ